MKPEECGTFSLTKEQAEAIWASAKAHEALRREVMPNEAIALRVVTDGVHRLKELGWREAIYAPKDRSPIQCIEAGSSGIHTGYRDEDGGFWLVDGDVWPSDPILWRPVEAPAEQDTPQ